MIKPLVLSIALLAFFPFSSQAQDFPAKGKVADTKGVTSERHILCFLKTDSANVPIITAIMHTLNPDWIESVSVLKDKEAIAQFGPKGKDGVVIFKLKPEQERAFLQTLKSHDRASAEKSKPVTIRLDDRLFSERSFPEPLYFIQTNTGEVAVSKEKVSTLNPDWIKSINVLNGAEAEKRFKEQGKKGIILITLNPEKEEEALRQLKSN